MEEKKMGLYVKGKVVGREVRSFDYTDKATGKKATGKRASIFVMDGGRPVEVGVHENDQFKVGQDVDIPVFVSAFGTKGGGGGYRLIRIKAE